jgi:AP endonuclease-1
MAKKISTASSDSSLSPPPDNIVSASETASVTKPAANGKKRKAETTPRTKRTTAQHAVEDTGENTGESPRPKRRTTKKLKVTEEVEDEVVAQESGDGEGKSKKAAVRRSKKAVTTKTIAEDDMVEDEVDAEVEIDAGGHGKVTTKSSVKKIARGKKGKVKDQGNDVDDKPKPKPKPKTKAKTKTTTAKNEPPCAERTKDIPHRIGAHVSIAGGKSPLCSHFNI